MTRILILKTAALGDVLRSTALLPGLVEKYPDARITWVTAHGALPLVERHPLVHEALGLEVADEAQVAALIARLGAEQWELVLSFDDEEPLCKLAAAVQCRQLSGALAQRDGGLVYTPDVEPWFDMGLLSVHGKERADAMKVENERSHPAIFTSMLGISMGQPELPLTPESEAVAAAFFEAESVAADDLVIGLNTGAGGRWRTKELPVERVIEFARLMTSACASQPTFLLLGGPPEAERNQGIQAGLAALAGGPRVIDAGSENSLLDFAAKLSRCDLLLTSDSLALHIAIARRVRAVAFFAPTSAAEIEMYGLGEKVLSTAPDYCSYATDADNSTITAERLVEAAQRVLVASAKAIG